MREAALAQDFADAKLMRGMRVTIMRHTAAVVMPLGIASSAKARTAASSSRVSNSPSTLMRSGTSQDNS
jgi:hypothetical protein